MSIDSNKTNFILSVWNLLKWEPTKKQKEQFSQLQELLREWNKKTNLTRLINGNDYWISQVYDSLWPLHAELQDPKHNHTYIDVGSGCGFPGIAIAIAMPNSNVTLLDSSNKKTIFLKEVVKEIGLCSQIKVITARAESAGQDNLLRGNFDFALARALAPANVVAEYLVPFLNSRGQALIFKGNWSNEEQRTLQNALLVLNAEIKEFNKLELPDNRGVRSIIRIKSIDKCPNNYPRSIGKPKKQPLGY